jgi:hypothetical protein
MEPSDQRDEHGAQFDSFWNVFVGIGSHASWGRRLIGTTVGDLVEERKPPLPFCL